MNNLNAGPSPFVSEKTLTKDTISLDVGAVFFWLIWNAGRASLETAR